MTAEETKTAGVKEKDRRLYFRSDLGKENMQPPAEAATWFKLVSVLLNNDDASGPGDWIGVVTSWKLPGTFDGISTNDLPKVQAAIDEGTWAKNMQASNWVGYAVGKALDINVSDEAGKTRVQRMLKEWMKSGVLKEDTQFNSRQGRDQVVIVVGERVF
jgi:hypothetical protein